MQRLIYDPRIGGEFEGFDEEALFRVNERQSMGPS